MSMKPLTSSSKLDKDVMICILNTCAVTQKAEQKARRIIRLMLKMFPNSIVIVTGCYAQLSSKEIQNIDNRVLVFPGLIKNRIVKIPNLLKEYLNQHTWNKDNFLNLFNNDFVLPKNTNIAEDPFCFNTNSFLSHSRASIKIQDGCNNSCSYCAIHLARGKSCSCNVQTVIERVKDLENNGFDEVVLTTINILQYQSEYKGKIINFSGLLQVLLENTKTINFRISSLYPQIINDKFCNVIKDNRVRPHFHISVQSGSNSILQKMNRTYKKDDVINACNKLRAIKQNPFIACDIITGFPSETEEDFLQTIDLCNKCNFTWIHAFPYSERPNTTAITLKNKVPQNISSKRAKILTDLAIKNKIEYINSFINKPINAIVETKKQQTQENNCYIYNAMTENFIHCQIKTNKLCKLSSQVKIKILCPLEEKIKKGGEIEAQAELI